LCAQRTRDLFAIAKFSVLVLHSICLARARNSEPAAVRDQVFDKKKSKAGRKRVANPHELVENRTANLVENSQVCTLVRIMVCGLYCLRLVRRLNHLIGTLKPHNNRPQYSNTMIAILAVDGWTVTFGNSVPPSPLLAIRGGAGFLELRRSNFGGLRDGSPPAGSRGRASRGGLWAKPPEAE